MNYIDFTKSALIILVVLGHSFTSWTAIDPTLIIDAPIIEYISNYLSTFHTITLTAVSGYTYEYITEEKRGYLFKNLINKKVRRLITPFLVVSICWILPLTLFFVDIDSDYLINKFVLGKSPAQLWFLLMLFDVFILFFPIRLLLEKSSIFYIVFPAFYYIGITYGEVSNNYYQFFTALRYLSYFALGHLAYKYRKFLFADHKFNLRQPYAMCLLAFIHVILYLVYLQDIPKTKTLLMLYLNFGGCLTAMSILFYVGEKVNPKNKLMTLLNQNSFAVYLLHQQIIYYTFFFFNGLICPMLHAFINFVVSFGLSLAMSVAFRRSRLVRVNVLGEKK